MPAYVISIATVADHEAWERYRAIAGPAAAQFGARYLARGAVPEVVEATAGELPPGATVTVIEFPDRDAIHAWYASDGYAGSEDQRTGGATAPPLRHGCGRLTCQASRPALSCCHSTGPSDSVV